MSQKKIKCAIYELIDDYGGGHIYVPYDCKQYVIDRIIYIYKVEKKPVGIYEFELLYLDQAFGRAYLDDNTMNWEEVYWNGTWCE